MTASLASGFLHEGNQLWWVGDAPCFSGLIDSSVETLNENPDT